MKNLKITIVAHLFLIPYAILTFVSDAKHPERWGDWWRNPTYAIPVAIVCECIIWGLVLDEWLKDRRMAKGIALLKKANRLLAEGNTEASDAAYQKGKRLCRLK